MPATSHTMIENKILKFSAKIEIIGINPFVHLPENILMKIFKQAGKTNGHIRIKGTINNSPYTQTLVKYSGGWRLYINTTMLKNSPKRIGEQVEITIAFNPEKREIAPHPKLLAALKKNKDARLLFENLRPSLQFEIIRYISSLKTEKSIDRNVTRAIDFLTGKDRFIGRDKL